MQINTMYQAMVEVTQLAAAANGAQGASSEGDSFDAMLQEQAQGAQQKPAEKAPAKKEPGKAQEKPAAEDKAQEGEPTAEGYAVAASLVTSQPVIVLETPKPQAEVSLAAPVEGAAEVDVPVLETATPVVQQAPEAMPQQEAPVEAVETGFAQEMAPAAAEEAQPELDAQAQPQDTAPVQVRKADAPQDAPETEVTVKDVEVEAQPVFRQETAVPVKVAENYEPLEPEAEDGLPQLAQRVAQMDQLGDSYVEIALSPENLGTMTIQMTRLEDGTLHIVLGAVSEKATALLQQHSAGLQHLLAMNNPGEVHVQVQEPAAQEHAANQNQQGLNPDGQNQQPQQQRQQEKRHSEATDFVQQLRLGLVGREEDAE